MSKRLTSIVAVIVVLFCCAVGFSAEQKAENKDNLKAAESTVPGNVGPVPAVPIVIPKIPSIPKPRIPTITMTYPDAVKSSEQGKAAPQTAQQAVPQTMPQAIPNSSKIRFQVSPVEIISVGAAKSDGTTITVKMQDGKEENFKIEPYLVVTKTMKVSELSKGEKVTLHYMVDEDRHETRVAHIGIGEDMQYGMPPIPAAPVAAPVPPAPTQKK